jgi:hypothetical protein
LTSVDVGGLRPTLIGKVGRSDVLVWFGFQTMVLVWFQLVLVLESSNQNQNHGAWFGLVWFWFKPWFAHLSAIKRSRPIFVKDF